jgi:hypothetical protein
VRRIKTDFYLRRRKGELQTVERSTKRIRKREPIPAPQNLHPQIGSGWITYSEWTRPAGTIIQRIYTQWVVPDAPTDYSGQTIYLFNGLENEAKTEIVQPVLQYGSSNAGRGKGWFIANWWVMPSGHAIISKPGARPVSSGVTITGVVTLLSQPNGKFTYVSQFVGYPELDVTASETDELCVACQTLEAYHIGGDQDFPASPSTSMTSVAIDLAEEAANDLEWKVSNPWLSTGQWSNVSNPSNPGGEVDIFYR